MERACGLGIDAASELKEFSNSGSGSFTLPFLGVAAGRS
jgi:hypothetical protein